MTVAATNVSQVSVGEQVIDRRRSPRQERATHAWLSAHTGAKSGNGVHVDVRDLSLHGVGIISKQPLQKHDIHWLVIADQTLRLSTRVRIVSSRQREDGTWDIGGEFF